MSEKLKMKSEKLRIPKLRFKEFNGVNTVQKLKEVIVSNTYGPRFNANDYNFDGNVKTIRGTDVTLDGNVLYNQVPTAKLDEQFIKNHILQDDDLVIITTADCGLTGIFEVQKEKYICSAYAVKITLDKSLAFPQYFKYFFQTTLAKNEVNKYIRKATVANLPASDILRISHRLPQKQEQEKIASFLSSIDKKIEQLSKKDELLEFYKKGVMQKIFLQEIRFKKDDGSDYSDWEEKKIKDITTKKSSNISANTLEENIGVFKIYGATGFLKSIDFYTEEEKYISIVKDGAGVGRVLLCDAKSSVLGTLDIIKNIENINLHFIYLLLTKIHFEKYIVGSTIPHIYYKDYSNEKIKIPCLEEQTKIANFLSSIDIKISQNKKALEVTKKFKKALLQQMFV